MKANPDGANLPLFLSAKNILPFVSNDLIEGLERRRSYKAKQGGGASNGPDVLCGWRVVSANNR